MGALQVCALQEPVQQLEPAACQPYLQADNVRPFSMKHAQQQASMVGHMQQAGLLEVMFTSFLTGTLSLETSLVTVLAPIALTLRALAGHIRIQVLLSHIICSWQLF